MIAACCKWVDLRPEVDPLDAHVRTDPRTAGCSAADAAALEWALRAGERWDQPVLAVTAGPPEADRVLRDAVAAGATRAVRIDLPTSAPSAVVATAIAAVLGPAGVSSVWCGDHSLDRGSGAVPAFLAAELGSAQALGLVDVELDARAGRVTAWRRLDRGRREHVRLDGPGVLSVEGSTARLRRAALGAVMSSGRAPIEVVTPGPAAREARRSRRRAPAAAVPPSGPRAPRPRRRDRARPGPRAHREHHRRQPQPRGRRARPSGGGGPDPRRARRVGLPGAVTSLGRQAWPDVASVRPLLAIPLGSCEQHGPHLPLDTDTTIAVAVASELARRRDDVLVAPALAYGASGEHAGFAGTLSIGLAALEHVLVELVRSADHFAGVVLVNGHGGNARAVERAVATLRREGRRVLAWWPSVPGGDAHAGRVETSLLLAIAPETVRMDLAAAGLHRAAGHDPPRTGGRRGRRGLAERGARRPDRRLRRRGGAAARRAGDRARAPPSRPGRPEPCGWRSTARPAASTAAGCWWPARP